MWDSQFGLQLWVGRMWEMGPEKDWSSDQRRMSCPHPRAYLSCDIRNYNGELGRCSRQKGQGIFGLVFAAEGVLLLCVGLREVVRRAVID